MTSHQRLIEKEVSRIQNFIKTGNGIYNPLDILNLSLPFDKQQLKTQYKKLLLLVHPDKTFNLERFNKAFHVINASNNILKDSHKLSICIKAKKKNNIALLEPLFEQTIIIHSQTTLQGIYSKKQIIVWQNNGQISTHFNNYFDKNSKNIIIDIAVDGAEHTKNKSKSKKNKHDKGLRQRVIQIQNAKRRIQNHDFSFHTNTKTQTFN